MFIFGISILFNMYTTVKICIIVTTNVTNPNDVDSLFLQSETLSNPYLHIQYCSLLSHPDPKTWATNKQMLIYERLLYRAQMKKEQKMISL